MSSLSVLRRVLTAAALVANVANASAQVPGLPNFDFDRYFPHLIAVSEQKTTSEFPNGIQYKFLTVRDRTENQVLLALVKRAGGEVSRVFLARGPINNSESTLRDVVERFSKTSGLTFEIVDLRDATTFDALRSRASSLGWGVQEIAR